MVAMDPGADNGFFYAGQVMHFSSPFTVFLIYHKHSIDLFRQISQRMRTTITMQTDKKGENTMLGLRIALLRVEKGWSQAELAKRIGVSTSAVGMYEQGRREPSLALLVCLSQALGVSTDYLLTGKGNNPLGGVSL